jgi:hypothetical protein
VGQPFYIMEKGKFRQVSLLIFITVIFTACNNPLHRTYSPQSYVEDIEAIRKTNTTSEEDLKSLEAYVMLEKLAGNDVRGDTYADLLEKIKALRQTANDLDGRQSSEKAVKRARLAPILSVVLAAKSFVHSSTRPQTTISVTFINTGSQKIRTVTGNLTINDLLEQPIKNVPVFLVEDLPPGQKLTKTFTIDYNDGDENDRRLRSKDFFDIRGEWNPGQIIYSNGQLLQ